MSDKSAERLQEIQAELSSILEARLAELTASLRDTESITRRIISAEFDIERHRATAERLEDEMGTLQTEVDTARARSEEVRKRHAALLSEREEFRAELDRLEREVRSADAEAEETRQRVTSLEADAETLRAENTSLKTKLKTLEENIARMRRLKEELMSSISGLTAQMTGLAGGGSE